VVLTACSVDVEIDGLYPNGQESTSLEMEIVAGEV
jgi:hypothetical protein